MIINYDVLCFERQNEHFIVGDYLKLEIPLSTTQTRWDILS